MPTFQDLAGFWDLLQLSIEDVSMKFAELLQLKANGWKIIEPKVGRQGCKYLLAGVGRVQLGVQGCSSFTLPCMEDTEDWWRLVPSSLGRRLEGLMGEKRELNLPCWV